MRTDNNLDENILTSKDWNDERPDQHLTYNVFETVEENGQTRQIMHSLSGWERNKLFLNRNEVFQDVSLISGVDSVSDSRAHCILDFNHDGFSDLTLVNGNNPQLQLFENQMSELLPRQNNFIAVKLVGGNTADKPSDQWSCRDAVGTLIDVDAGSLSYVRELRFGEGFAGQNSKTLILGIGGNETANLKIRWMSGKSQSFDDISAGKLVTVFENPKHSKDGSGCQVHDYYVENSEQVSAISELPARTLELVKGLEQNEYQLVTSMATWCLACKKMAPQLKLLKEKFGDRLGLVGLPMDLKDSPDDLKAYEQQQQPAYALFHEGTDKHRELFMEYVSADQGKVSLPSSVLVDSQGAVVKTWLGVPSVSEIAVLLDHGDSR